MINSEEIQRIFKRHKCDYYSKKLKTAQLIPLLVLAQYNQASGNRSVSIDLAFNSKLQNYLKLDSISHSQVFRRLNDLPTEALEDLFSVIVSKVKKTLGKSASSTISGLNLIDSSTITKALTGMEWAKFRDSKAGIKLHLALESHENFQFPNNVLTSIAKEHDVAYLKDLVILSKTVINVFDRGYVDYKVYDQFAEDGILFVTRLKDNAATWLVERYPVDVDGTVRYHDLVKIGSGRKKTKNAFRFIQMTDEKGKELKFLTNVFDKSVEEICAIYKERWQIELFFKWIKTHFKVKHFFATSPQAVTNQIYIALIGFCLLALIKLDTDARASIYSIQVALQHGMFDSYESFKRRLFRISPH